MIRATAAGGWPAIVVHAILLQVLTYAVRPALSYAVLEAGGSAALLGLLGTAFALPALALALPAGRIVDRLGERSVAIGGGVLFIAAAGVALASLGAAAGLVVAAFLLGVGHLLGVVSEQTAVAHRSTQGRREQAFGYYAFTASIGQALGPLLLALPGGEQSDPNLVLVFGVSLVIAVAVTISSCFIVSAPRTAGVEQPGMVASGVALLRAPGVLRALIASSISLASIDVTLAFWPALGAERGLPAVVVSAMLTVRAVSSVVSRGVLPLLARRLRRRTIFVTALAVSAVSLALTGLVDDPIALLAAASLYGLAIGVCQPISMAMLADVAPAPQRGMATSLRLAGNRVGQSTLPALVGALAPATGAAGILVAMSAALAIAVAVAFREAEPGPGVG